MLVSTVIAVALITSISTLAAASISAYIAFLVSRNHNATELAVAKDNRIDQQFKERRQIRRDAYVQFLNQANTVDQCLGNYWHEILSSSDLTRVSDNLQAVKTGLEYLQRLGNLVALEGPDDVTDSARKLQSLLTQANGRMVLFIYKPELAKEPDNARLYLDLGLKRIAATNEMIKVARKALNDSPHESAVSVIDT